MHYEITLLVKELRDKKVEELSLLYKTKAKIRETKKSKNGKRKVHIVNIITRPFSKKASLTRPQRGGDNSQAPTGYTIYNLSRSTTRINEDLSPREK